MEEEEEKVVKDACCLYEVDELRRKHGKRKPGRM